MPVPTPAAAARDVWSTGDFHSLGVTQQLVGELLVADLHVHHGERVLDVAVGSGNAALAAARRGAHVTCTDIVPGLLTIARERAAAERLPLHTCVSDAHALPHPDGAFDVVTSTFGVMFARDQQRAADEVLRVLRPGGRLGLTAWTPDGFSGAQFDVLAPHLPPPPGPPPTAWGSPEHVTALLGDRVGTVTAVVRDATFVGASPEAMFEFWLTSAAPLIRAWRATPASGRAGLRQRWTDLVRRFDVAADGTCEVPAQYLQITATTRCAPS